jgi:hypothetical protein
MRGVDNYLSVSLLAVCECRAGTWVKEKDSRLGYTWLGDTCYWHAGLAGSAKAAGESRTQESRRREPYYREGTRGSHGSRGSYRNYSFYIACYGAHSRENSIVNS